MTTTLKSRLHRSVSSIERMFSNAGPVYRIVHGLWSKLPGDEITSNQMLGKLIRSFLARNQPRQVRVLQIGAYDGMIGDPLYPFLNRDDRWQGVLVEPHVQAYNKLKSTYRHRPNLELVNCAITQRDEQVQLYCPPTFNRWNWTNQVSSLHQETHCKLARLKSSRDHSLSVPGKTLDTLIRETNLKQIDIVCIDTEGADAVILRQLLDSHLEPFIISWESWQIEEQEQTEFVRILEQRGYHVSNCYPDTHSSRMV